MFNASFVKDTAVIMLLSGSQGQQIDSYVDDLFDPVLDHGPQVSDINVFVQFLINNVQCLLICQNCFI